jgi:flagellar basal body P-ring formation protein FlgA
MNSTIRTTLAALATAVALTGATAPVKADVARTIVPAAAKPATLGVPVAARQQATVSGDMIRLSDLFDGVSPQNDADVGTAPDPGHRLIYKADLLQRVASRHGLSWQPASWRDRVIVERASAVVPDATIRAAVEKALMNGYVADEIEVDLANSSARLLVPDTSFATVRVHEVNFDDRSRHFSAVVSAPADDPAAPRARVSGRVYAMAQIPVMGRHAMPGEVIRADDIVWQRVRTQHTNYNTATSLDQLVDRVVRRPLVAGQSIRRSDVVEQVLIQKGELVVITFRTPSMVLSTRAEAMENGTMGETIRFRNSQTKRMIQAEVTGAGMALVEGKQLVALN